MLVGDVESCLCMCHTRRCVGPWAQSCVCWMRVVKEEGMVEVRKRLYLSVKHGVVLPVLPPEHVM